MIKLLVRMTSLAVVVVGLCVDSVPVRGQEKSQGAAKEPNKLLTARLICVTPMIDGLDRWITEDLQAWGRYRVTQDPEGADLVISAYKPEKAPQYVLRQGDVPQPKKVRHEPPPAVQVTVIDWVRNEALWQADVIDKKPKKDGPEAEPGPATQVYARGLKPDELAQKLTRKLREYVAGLEKNNPH